jgi:hypothetical protein
MYIPLTEENNIRNIFYRIENEPKLCPICIEIQNPIAECGVCNQFACPSCIEKDMHHQQREQCMFCRSPMYLPETKIGRYLRYRNALYFMILIILFVTILNDDSLFHLYIYFAISWSIGASMLCCIKIERLQRIITPIQSSYLHSFIIIDSLAIIIQQLRIASKEN